MTHPRRVTVRFGDAAHRIVSEAAAREGVSLAQYVREATLARASVERVIHGAGRDPGGFQAFRAEVRLLRDLLDPGH